MGVATLNGCGNYPYPTIHSSFSEVICILFWIFQISTHFKVWFFLIALRPVFRNCYHFCDISFGSLSLYLYMYQFGRVFLKHDKATKLYRAPPPPPTPDVVTKIYKSLRLIIFLKQFLKLFCSIALLATLIYQTSTYNITEIRWTCCIFLF